MLSVLCTLKTLRSVIVMSAKIWKDQAERKSVKAEGGKERG